MDRFYCQKVSFTQLLVHFSIATCNKAWSLESTRLPPLRSVPTGKGRGGCQMQTTKTELEFEKGFLLCQLTKLAISNSWVMTLLSNSAIVKMANLRRKLRIPDFNESTPVRMCLRSTASRKISAFVRADHCTEPDSRGLLSISNNLSVVCLWLGAATELRITMRKEFVSLLGRARSWIE